MNHNDLMGGGESNKHICTYERAIPSLSMFAILDSIIMLPRGCVRASGR